MYRSKKKKNRNILWQVKNFIKHYAASSEFHDSKYKNVVSVSEKSVGVGGSTVDLEKERVKLRLENGKILK